MTSEQQARFDQIVAFHEELTRFREMLRAKEQAKSITSGELRRIEELRQSLLRRAGVVESLYVRLEGYLVQPGPFGAPSVSIWQIALHDHPVYSQSHFAGVLADEISPLIGRLEAGPSLLDPPKARELPRDQRPSMSDFEKRATVPGCTGLRRREGQAIGRLQRT